MGVEAALIAVLQRVKLKWTPLARKILMFLDGFPVTG